MSKLEDIEVRVEQTNSPSQVLAILNELQSKLTALAEQGTNDSIDLRSLPLFPGDYEQLKERLGFERIRIDGQRGA